MSIKPLETLIQFLYCNFTILKWRYELNILPEDLDLRNELEFFLPRPKECESIDRGLGGRWVNFYWCVNAAEKECKKRNLKVVRTTGLFMNTILFLAKNLCFLDRINVIKFFRDPRANFNKLKWIAHNNNKTLEKIATIWCDRHLRSYTIMKDLEIRYPDMFLRVPYEAMVEDSSMYCFQTIDDYLYSGFSFYFRDPNLLRYDCENLTRNDPRTMDINAAIRYLTNWIYTEEDNEDLNLVMKVCNGFMYEAGYQIRPECKNPKTKEKKVLNRMRREEEIEWSFKATRNKYQEPTKNKYQLVQKGFS